MTTTQSVNVNPGRARLLESWLRAERRGEARLESFEHPARDVGMSLDDLRGMVRAVRQVRALELALAESGSALGEARYAREQADEVQRRRRIELALQRVARRELGEPEGEPIPARPDADADYRILGPSRDRIRRILAEGDQAVAVTAGYPEVRAMFSEVFEAAAAFRTRADALR